MYILFMVGTKQEPLHVIDQLLDVETLKERPAYEFAEGESLILAECGFDDLSWTNYNFYSDMETFNVIDSKLQQSLIDQGLLQILKNHYLQKEVRADYIELGSKGAIKILKSTNPIIDPSAQPDRLFKFSEVLDNTEFISKAKKRRDEAFLQNKAKILQLNPDFRVDAEKGFNFTLI